MIQRLQILNAGDIQKLVGESPVMLEIGANDGTDTLRFLSAMPSIRLWCFECDLRAIRVFKDRISCKRVCLVEKAVSDSDGETDFWASGGRPDCSGPGDWNKSSAICRPTGHYQMSPEVTFHEAGKVPTIRLDTWLNQHPLPHIDFLWADVQGAEHKMIHGGQETLRRTAWLYTEFYDTPMYEGQLPLAELHAMLPGGTRDWELIGLYGGKYRNALLRNAEGVSI